MRVGPQIRLSAEELMLSGPEFEQTPRTVKDRESHVLQSMGSQSRTQQRQKNDKKGQNASGCRLIFMLLS